MHNLNLSVDDLISRLSDTHTETKTAAAVISAGPTQSITLAERKAEATAAFAALSSSSTKVASQQIPQQNSLELYALQKQAAELEQAETLADMQTGALIGTSAAQAFLGEMDKYASVAQTLAPAYTQKQAGYVAQSSDLSSVLADAAEVGAAEAAGFLLKVAADAGRRDASIAALGPENVELIKQAESLGRQDAFDDVMSSAAETGREDATLSLLKIAAEQGGADARSHLSSAGSPQGVAHTEEAINKLAEACSYTYNDALTQINEILA